jgi:hypothetical protein
MAGIAKPATLHNLRHAPARGEHRRPGVQVLPGHAKLTTTARYANVVTKTIQSAVSPFERMGALQDQVLRSDGPDLRRGPRSPSHARDRGHLPDPWPRVAAGRCRACQPRPGARGFLLPRFVNVCRYRPARPSCRGARRKTFGGIRPSLPCFANPRELRRQDGPERTPRHRGVGVYGLRHVKHPPTRVVYLRRGSGLRLGTGIPEDRAGASMQQRGPGLTMRREVQTTLSATRAASRPGRCFTSKALRRPKAPSPSSARPPGPWRGRSAVRTHSGDACAHEGG